MATFNLKMTIGGCEIIVPAEITSEISGDIKVVGKVEVDNLQTNGDIYLGKGEGNGGHIEMFRGDSNFPSILTAATENADTVENIMPAVAGNLAINE